MQAYVLHRLLDFVKIRKNKVSLQKFPGSWFQILYATHYFNREGQLVGELPYKVGFFSVSWSVVENAGLTRQMWVTWDVCTLLT